MGDISMQLTFEVVLDRHACEMLSQGVHLFLCETGHGCVFVNAEGSEDAGRSEVGDAVKRQQTEFDLFLIGYLYSLK